MDKIKQLKEDSYAKVRNFVWEYSITVAAAILLAEKVQKYQGQKNIAIIVTAVVMLLGMFFGKKK